jgi:hypothetical protein
MAKKREPDKETVSAVMREMGSRGGKARKRALTAEELSEQGKKAVTARWSKAKKKPK